MALIPAVRSLLFLWFSKASCSACGQKVRVLQAARWYPVRLLTANAVHHARSKSRFARGSSGYSYPAKAPDLEQVHVCKYA